MNKIIRIGKSEYHRNEIPEQKQTVGYSLYLGN